MISRVFVRTVLVAIITAMVWLVDLTWSIPFRVISHPILLTIIESAVLLAALSLLIESFRSFGVITVNRNSPWFVLSGLASLEVRANEEKKDLVSARTCELFMVRSLILAFSSIVAAMVISVLYLVIVGAVQFLSDPHVPTINWGEIAKFVGVMVSVIIPASLLFWGWMVLDKKLAGRSSFVKGSVLNLYGVIGLGILLGTAIFMTDGSVATPSLLMSILMAISLLLGIALASIAVVALAYGLYRLVGKTSARYSILGNVWNTICPVRTIVIK